MEGKSSTMVIIEPRFLVRDGLVSLMESHSYHVVGAVESATGDKTCRIVLAPKIVILGADSAEGAAAEASAVRRAWPNAKIILLYEQASGEDFTHLTVAHIDACLPMSVSSPALLGILELVLKDGHRIFVAASTSGLIISSPNKKQNAVHLAGATSRRWTMGALRTKKPASLLLRDLPRAYRKTLEGTASAKAYGVPTK